MKIQKSIKNVKIVTEIMNVFDRFTNRPDTAEERISELEDMSR